MEDGVAERVPNRTVASNLCVDPSTVSRTLALFHATFSVTSLPDAI